MNGVPLMKKNYEKLPLNIEEQIALLKDRGLIIEDEEKARFFLGSIGYYRLSAYLRNFYKDTNSNYEHDVSFDDILNLYNFDSGLKVILFEALEKIEVHFKAQIINDISVKYGTAFWYTDEKYYISQPAYFNILRVLDKDIEKNRNNSKSLQHYFLKYNNPDRPPFWMVMQISPFGNVCSIYKALLTVDKVLIAKRYNARYQQIESWMVGLSYLRNICAHSDWVCNRDMKIQLTVRGLPETTGDGTTIFSYLVVLLYLLQQIDYNFYENWKSKLLGFIKEHHKKKDTWKYMGIQEDWEVLLSGDIRLN